LALVFLRSKNFHLTAQTPGIYHDHNVAATDKANELHEHVACIRGYQ